MGEEYGRDWIRANWARARKAAKAQLAESKPEPEEAKPPPPDTKPRPMPRILQELYRIRDELRLFGLMNLPTLEALIRRCERYEDATRAQKGVRTKMHRPGHGVPRSDGREDR